MSDSTAFAEMSDFSLVHVATRHDPADCAKSLATALGIDVTADPNTVATGPGDLRVLWFGAGRWLIHAPVPGWVLDEIPACAVTDMSDSRRVFRWRGEDVVRRLAQSCPLDLRESSMPVGTSALTQFDRFSILLYRRDMNEFDLYVERSYGDAIPGATS